MTRKILAGFLARGPSRRVASCAATCVAVASLAALSLFPLPPAAHTKKKTHKKSTSHKSKTHKHKKASSSKSKPHPSAPTDFVQEGMASWYGRRFHGKKTASGERYNMYAYTAAHRTLPFGTYVRVTNLGNKKQVVVRINDRGPWTKNRIIDLSYAAAKKIGMIEKGYARVRIEVVKSGAQAEGQEPEVSLEAGGTEADEINN